MYEDDFLVEGDPDFQDDYDDYGDEGDYGDYGDYGDLDDDRFLDFMDTPGTTMGKAEITAFERVGPSMVDPWILKMTNLPKHFKKFILGSTTLDALRKSNLNCINSFLSSFTFNSGDILKSLNPLALSLSHYIRTSDGGIDKKKLTEVSQLLTSGQSCNSDTDCKSKIHPMCKSSKCITNIIDLGSIIRYLSIWNKVYNINTIDEDDDDEIEEDLGITE